MTIDFNGDAYKKKAAIEKAHKKRRALIGKKAYDWLSSSEPEIIAIIEEYISLGLTAGEIKYEFTRDFETDGEIPVMSRTLKYIALAAEYLESQKREM